MKCFWCKDELKLNQLELAEKLILETEIKVLCGECAELLTRQWNPKKHKTSRGNVKD